MSDIDDILSEFSAPSGPQGYNRYIPDPNDYNTAQQEAQKSSFEGMSSAASDMWNHGVGPTNVAQAALNGLSYIASPLTGFGEYLAGPIRRGLSDMGHPNIGQVAGNTVAMAPAMFAPFPGAKTIGGLAEGAGALIGEAPAARSVMQNAPTMLAGKAAAVPKSDIDEVLEEAGGVRQTSAAKSLEERVAERWFQRQFLGGDEVPNIASAPGAPDPANIRLLHKSNPKVGENKYAKDEGGNPVVWEGYQNQGERPTYRTSKMPGGKSTDEAPEEFYNNAFRRLFEPDNVALGSPPSQIPLHPDTAKVLPESLGVDSQRMKDMYLPNIENRSEVDPNLLAELKLKFGGSPKGAGINPQPAPFPGARNQYPWSNGNNVMFPAGDQSVYPIPMGVEARQNTNRLRTDLGAELDPEQIFREEMAKRPNLSAGPNGEAVSKSAPASDPLEAMKKRVEEVAGPMPAPTETVLPPEGNKRTYDSKDIASVIKAIKDARPTPNAQVFYSDLQQQIPGVSKAMLDKAFSKIKEGNPAYFRKTDPEKGQYISLTPKNKVEARTAKDEHFDKAIKVVTDNGKLKNTYLRNLDPMALQAKDRTIDLKRSTITSRLNKLISEGKVKVYPEGESDNPLKQVLAKHITGEDFDNDFVVEFVKQKKPKAVKGE